MANNIYDYDEINPLRQPQRDVLRYSSQPQEDSAYLVELREDLPDLSPPPHHSTLRSRNTTIVNTSYIPESPEEEQEPLEAYIKKNLIIFRKSLTPDGLTYTSRRIPSEKGDEGSLLVIPGNNEESAFNLNHLRSDHKIKDNVVTEMAKSDNFEYDERKDNQNDDNVGATALLDDEDIHSREDVMREDGIHFQINDTIVMQVSDHVALNQNSPFTAEKNKTNKQPVSPVQVIVMVDSYEHANDKNYLKDKKSTKKGYNELEEDGLGAKGTTWSHKEHDKSDPNRMVLDRSKGVQNIREKDKDPERFGKVTDGKDGKRKDGKYDPDRMGLDRSKGMQKMGEKDNDTDQFGKVTDGKDGKRKDGKYDPDRMGLDRSKGMQNIREKDRDPEKFNKVDGKGEKRKDDYKTGISNQTPDSKQKKERKGKHELEDSDEEYYNKPKDLSGKTGNVMKTKPGKSAADGKRPADNEPTQDYKRTNANSELPKNLTVKAPKTATQMFARKRYHIQIPQHGQPETWFNVCFNLDRENNVDMNYEGPVKITHYYSSNKYA